MRWDAAALLLSLLDPHQSDGQMDMWWLGRRDLAQLDWKALPPKVFCCSFIGHDGLKINCFVRETTWKVYFLDLTTVGRLIR